MKSNRDKKVLPRGDVWVISQSRHTDVDLKGIHHGVKAGPVTEYEISDLGRYMLSPDPIEVKKKLIGCEVRYHQGSSTKMGDKIRQILPKKLRPLNNPSETLMWNSEAKTPSLKDKDLEFHVKKLHASLRYDDPLLKRLSKLDVGKISDVLGICDDMQSNGQRLKLQGTIEEKINYVRTFISEEVGVILERAHISDGLFEMRGFDFQSYDPEESYSLIKFLLDGTPRLCVRGPGEDVEYWIEDVRLLHYMQLLEHSIRTNPNFHDSLKLCTQASAQPLTLLFYKQLRIDYSKSHCPDVYREVFRACGIEPEDRDMVVDSLNNLQLGISFNYSIDSSDGSGKLVTSISVMHDIRALEPLKETLPQLYSEISSRALASGAGKFYLLDSIERYVDE